MYGLNSEREAISVSLRHLKLFESVARLSSVRRASEECHLSQPAVTQAIAKLEEQIGTQPAGARRQRKLSQPARGHLPSADRAAVRAGRGGAGRARGARRPRSGDGEPHQPVADQEPDRHRRERLVRPSGARPRRLAGDAQPRRPGSRKRPAPAALSTHRVRNRGDPGRGQVCAQAQARDAGGRLGHRGARIRRRAACAARS